MPLCMHDQLLHSYLTLTTPWTVAHQAPLYMGFSMQEYWSGLPCLPPGDLPHPGIEFTSLMSPALLSEFLTTRTIWAFNCLYFAFIFERYFHYVKMFLCHLLPCIKNSANDLDPSNSAINLNWSHPQMIMIYSFLRLKNNLRNSADI